MPVRSEVCRKCGMPKAAIQPDGTMAYLRCQCDYQRELLDRRNSTVDKSYWGLSMGNWAPAIYSAENAGAFQKYIRVQRLSTLYKLWEYCFRVSMDGERVTYALQSSVEQGKTLFVRGPKGSGRGLLAACVKTAAAIKGISATPLPCDFAVFKTEMQESESQSRAGDDAKIAVWQKYASPSLLVLENVRADSHLDMRGVSVPRKFRASGAIDALLSKRMPMPHGMLITSCNFIGEIASTLGDVMMDVLESPKTTPLVLLSPKEAEAILWALVARRAYMLEVVTSFRKDEGSTKAERKLTQERLAEKLSLASMEEAIYFEEVFQSIPDSREGDGAGIHEQFGLWGTTFDTAAMKIWLQFVEDKERKSLAYEKGRQAALMGAIRSCKDLSGLLSDKECQEIGKIASKATAKDESFVQGMEDKAKSWLADMGADETT